ncbi:MAG: glycoside hydrolase family 13 protein [Bacilli bacterium]|nr:glycoside hydrolase family 13 protein [Bacilli bacterium]
MNDVSFKINEIEKLENGNNYQIIVEIPFEYGFVDNLDFIIEKGNKTMVFPLKHLRNIDNKAYFETNVYLETSAIYHYYFKYKINNQIKYIKKENLLKDLIKKDEMYKMSVNFETPNWAKGKVMYHIFVDRFNRSHDVKLFSMPRRTIYNSFSDEMKIGPDKNNIWNADFYGGNLKGIEEKLDYIKSLGVEIIYLSPIVYSQSNHRYDTSDYEQVDPYAGSNQDLKDLCDKAHEKGMKIVLDAVFNHTGNDSKYFNEYNTFNTIGAFQSDDSPYASFYKQQVSDNKTTFDYWWGMTNLPVCDANSNEWKNYILGVGGIIDQWFKLGIDGLRLDVADELTDEFIEGIRVAVKRNKEDGLILGEVWKNPMRMQRGYIDSGKCLDTVMNYSLIDALIRYFKYNDITKLANILKDIKREYPTDTINTLMNFTSTHDISRAINIFSAYDFNEFDEWAWNLKNNNLDYCQNYKLTKEQYEYGKNIYKAYVFTLTFLPGILSIFYGDEVGVEGIGNLANRKPYPWNKQDMDLLNYFKYIGNIRKQEPFLQEADLNILDINQDYFMFERYNNNESTLVTINRTPDEKEFILPREYKGKSKTYTLNNSKSGYLSPYGGVAIKK